MYPPSEKSVPKISSSWALEGTISNKQSCFTEQFISCGLLKHKLHR